MKKLVNFYDDYHKKNSYFNKIIVRNNFTYFYILQFLHKHCMDYFRNKFVLDVGSGVGTLSLYLAQFSKAVVGVDISKRAIEISENAREHLGLRHVRFFQGSVFSDLPIFDFILCSEVIEHIEDDDLFVHKLGSNLKKNGHLYITTPLKENLFYKMGYYKKFDSDVGHYRRYTVESLRSILEKHGFEVLTVEKAGGPLRDILFMSRLGFLIRFIRGPLVYIFHFIDDCLADPLGKSDLMILARKK